MALPPEILLLVVSFLDPVDALVFGASISRTLISLMPPPPPDAVTRAADILCRANCHGHAQWLLSRFRINTRFNSSLVSVILRHPQCAPYFAVDLLKKAACIRAAVSSRNDAAVAALEARGIFRYKAPLQTLIRVSSDIDDPIYLDAHAHTHAHGFNIAELVVLHQARAQKRPNSALTAWALRHPVTDITSIQIAAWHARNTHFITQARGSIPFEPEDFFSHPYLHDSNSKIVTTAFSLYGITSASHLEPNVLASVLEHMIYESRSHFCATLRALHIKRPNKKLLGRLEKAASWLSPWHDIRSEQGSVSKKFAALIIPYITASTSS